jgi:Polyketide cyclase / dehydrase and lipid transport
MEQGVIRERRIPDYASLHPGYGDPTETTERNMASIRKEILTQARPDDAWDALRDIGALHTRLVPGFVTDTRLEPGARVVTFGNGAVVRELIITVDDDARRVVWSVVGGSMTHHNASAQVFAHAKGLTRVVWVADLLPDEAAGVVGAMMEQGMAVMKQTLDEAANKAKASDKPPP